MSSYYDKAEYILAIAEERSISRAARKLYVSQSTLTMYLNRVEAEFGTALFDRTVRPIMPTKAGLLYINNLRAVQRMEKDFMADLRHIVNPEETFTIGIGSIRSRLYMPALIEKMREIYPRISVNIGEGCDAQLPDGLYHGSLDMIFGCFNPMDLLFADTVLVGRETVGLIAPRCFGLVEEGWDVSSPENPYPISIQQLKFLPVIIPSQENDLHPYIMELLDRYMICPHSVIMTKSAFTSVAMVSKGLAYAFVEYPFLRGIGEEELRGLDYLSLKEQSLAEKQIIAAYSKKSIKIEMIRTVIQLFTEIFNQINS